LLEFVSNNEAPILWVQLADLQQRYRRDTSGRAWGGTAEAGVGGALRGHERLFACGAIRVGVVGVLGEKGLAEESSCVGCCS
jgi:hypothetical protein